MSARAGTGTSTALPHSPNRVMSPVDGVSTCTGKGVPVVATQTLPCVETTGTAGVLTIVETSPRVATPSALR